MVGLGSVILFFSMRRTSIWVLTTLSLALSLAGCHSTRKVIVEEPGVTETVEEPTTIESDSYLSRRLGIDIGKGDKEYLKLLSEAEKWLGVPYRYGGNTRSGCDCSGFVSQVYNRVYGKALERNSAAMKDVNCKEIKSSQLRTGDLVFFKTGTSGRINHVGIYLKNRKFIHSSSSRGVIVSSLDERYYQRTYDSAGRVN